MYLRQLNREGASFRKQAAMGEFVYDFADLGARLLIELDGGVHSNPEVALRDAAKEAWAESQGFKLLRMKNEDAWGLPDAIIDRLRRALHAPHPCPSPQGGGEEVE